MRAFFMKVIAIGWAALALAAISSAASAADADGTLTLTASKSTVEVGESFTVTATFTGTGLDGTVGSYELVNDDVSLGSMDFTNPKSLDISANFAGPQSFVATVSGNGHTWTSNTLTVAVKYSSLATTTSLTATPVTVSYGGSVTLKATVAATGAVVSGGTVTFKEGSKLLGSANVAAGKAQLVLKSELQPGSHAIAAIYGGVVSDTARQFGASSSSAVNVKVNALAGSLSLSADDSHVKPGHSLKLVATAKDAKGKPIKTLAGAAISFKVGKTVLGTAYLDTSGVATLQTTKLPFGSQKVTASLPSLAKPTSNAALVQVDYFDDKTFSLTPDNNVPKSEMGKVAVASIGDGEIAVVQPSPSNQNQIMWSVISTSHRSSGTVNLNMKGIKNIENVWIGNIGVHRGVVLVIGRTEKGFAFIILERDGGTFMLRQQHEYNQDPSTAVAVGTPINMTTRYSHVLLFKYKKSGHENWFVPLVFMTDLNLTGYFYDFDPKKTTVC